MAVYKKRNTNYVFELKRNQANIPRHWKTTHLTPNESNSGK